MFRKLVWALLLPVLLGWGVPCPAADTIGLAVGILGIYSSADVPPNPAPGPAPTPDSTTCDNCGGTGKLGDGKVFVVCPVCKGTGKTAKPDPASPTKPASKSASKTASHQTVYKKFLVKQCDSSGCRSYEQWYQKTVPASEVATQLQAGWSLTR